MFHTPQREMFSRKELQFAAHYRRVAGVSKTVRVQDSLMLTRSSGCRRTRGRSTARAVQG